MPIFLPIKLITLPPEHGWRAGAYPRREISNRVEVWGKGLNVSEKESKHLLLRYAAGYRETDNLTPIVEYYVF